jgi:hypothetical protein
MDRELVEDWVAQKRNLITGQTVGVFIDITIREEKKYEMQSISYKTRDSYNE